MPPLPIDSGGIEILTCITVRLSEYAKKLTTAQKRTENQQKTLQIDDRKKYEKKFERP